MDVSVRYIVDDVDAAIEFCRDRLDSTSKCASRPVPATAHLLLNAPGAGGAGRVGGNRIPADGTASSSRSMTGQRQSVISSRRV